MKKMTYVQALEIAINAVAENIEVAEKLTALKTSIDKKNSRDHKPTARQTANEEIKTAILNGMEIGNLYTVTDLIKTIPELNELTNQKVSSLVAQLVNADLVTREEIKRKAYFSLVNSED